MSKYKALLQEKADLVSEQKRMFEAAEKENRDLTAQEKTRDDEINARLEVVADELHREQRRREWERTVAPVQEPEPPEARISVHERSEDDPRRGFHDLGEFALAVRDFYRPGGVADGRLLIGAAPTNYHQETGSDEGRMVPPAFRQAIWEAVTEGDDSLLSAVDAEPTESNAVEFLRDEATPWGATGVQAAWRVEGAQMSASKLATKAEQLRLHELYAFVLATGELLQDAPRLADRLTRKAGLAIRYKINEAIVNGDGAGQPLGWFTSAAKVSVAKESGQTAATIVAANVAKMFARILRMGPLVWYVNPDCLPQLVTMTLGNNIIYMPPSSGFQGAPGGYLFGIPVVPLENCATLGTTGDIQLVAPKGYYAVHKGTAPEFATSIHLYFDYNLQAFRWIFRFAGQPYLSAPISPAKGSATRSHFVMLDTRS